MCSTWRKKYKKLGKLSTSLYGGRDLQSNSVIVVGNLSDSVLRNIPKYYAAGYAAAYGQNYLWAFYNL